LANALRILLLANSDGLTPRILDAFKSAEYSVAVERVETTGQYSTALASNNFDIGVLDIAAPPMSSLLEILREGDGQLPLLVFSNGHSSEIESKALEYGAGVFSGASDPSSLRYVVQNARRMSAARILRSKYDELEQTHRAILERVAAGAPLSETLESIVRMIEAQRRGLICSILLLDSEKGVLRHGAAPNVPREYISAIDGAAIHSTAGSCGAAASRAERIIVEDIATHPNWIDYKHIALPHGLKACWSSPIFSPAGAVLGTFAIYYRECRGPAEDELRWVDRATFLASLAIGRDKNERDLRNSESKVRQLLETAHEGVWMIDLHGRTQYVNKRMAALLGYDQSEMRGRNALAFVYKADRPESKMRLRRRSVGVSEQYEVRFVRRDRSIVWVILAGSPVVDEFGNVVGSLGMITDVTEERASAMKLERSETEFRAIFNHSAIGMVLVSFDGRILKFNTAFSRFVGCTPPEIEGSSFQDYTDVRDVHREIELYQALVSGERESYQNERRFVRKDGGTVWGRETISLVRGLDRSVMYAVAMIEDVTETRQLLETIRQEERFRRLIYENITDVVFYLAVEGKDQFRFLTVNPAFLKATGLREDQVVGRLLSEVIPGSSYDLVLLNYKKAVSEHRTIRWEEVTEYPAGVKYGEVSITPVFDASGRCVNLVGTVHDITERKEAEIRIAEQAALLDHASDAILVRGLDHVVHYWNKGAQNMYGWTRQEAVGRKIIELIYVDRSDFDRATLQCLREGVWTGELVQYTKSGRATNAHCSWTLFYDEAGRPKYILAINTDVTEKRKLESRLALSQRLESLGFLAGGIAHDFNNVLTVVMGNAQLATSQLPSDHPVQEKLSIICSAGRRATDLVRQILAFSRNHEPIRQRTKLQLVVAEALKFLGSTIPAMIDIQTRLSPETPQIFGDPSQIHQIIMNIVTNAVHAMEERGGVLRIETEPVTLESTLAAIPGDLRPGRYVRLCISDTGRGMEPSTLNQIFDPFFTTKPNRGTGLGLSVVSDIVRNHGGGIEVISRPNAGTSFAIYFPVAGEGIASDAGKAVEVPLGRGEHVLYVDDEKSIVTLVVALLEGLGYKVTGETNPSQALKTFHENPDGFNVVVTDQAMAGMSGLELIREIHTMKPELPIILVSGYLTSHQTERARSEGARSVLLKPGFIRDLPIALKKVIS
jgi:PAS domain S-box-containing protein